MTRAGKLTRAVNALLSLVLAAGLLPALPAVASANELNMLAPAEPAAELGSVRVIVENTTFIEPVDNLEPAWKGTLVDADVALKAESTMGTCIVDAVQAAGKEIDYTTSSAFGFYISGIEGLEQFDGGDNSGWMGTLNDWFTDKGFANYTVENGSLSAGDEIRVMYTCTMYDLGNPYNTDKTLANIDFSAGSLDRAFSPSEHAYTLTVPEGTTSVKVTPTAANKNFQVRTFVGDTQYKRGVDIPVSDGSIITVKSGYANLEATDDGGVEVYTFAIKTAMDFAPRITAQPAGFTCKVGDSARLTVRATAAEGAVLSYQWFEASDGEYVAIEGETSSRFRVPTVEAGTRTYCCDVTATINNQTYTTRSHAAKMIIKSAGAEVVGQGTFKNANWTVYDSGVLKFSKVEGTDGRTEDASAFDAPPYVTYHKGMISSVVIDEGITYLGEYLLNGLNAASITFPESLIDIGEKAFYGCDALKAYNCAKSGAVYIDGNYLLANYGKKLVKVMDTSLLKGVVTIPSTVTAIGEQFRGATAITGIELPAGLTSLAPFAFYGCKGLRDITIPCNLSAGCSAFAGCSNLTSVTFAEGVTSVLGGGLGSLGGLESIHFPSTLVEFDGLLIGSGVTNVTFAEGSPFSVKEGVITKTTDSGVEIVKALAGAKVTDEDGMLVVPQNIIAIGNGAYRDNTDIRAVALPDMLDSIGDYAFSGCSSLSGELSLPQGITKLGAFAFYGTNISRAFVPFGVAFVGQDLFSNCNSLKELVLASNLNCSVSICRSSDSLERIVVAEGVTSLTGSALAAYSATSLPKLESLSLPASLEDFQATALLNQAALTTIDCAQGGKFSFENGLMINILSHEIVFSLMSLSGCVDVPQDIVSIGDSAFFGRANIESVVFPDGLASIGKRAFNGCVGIAGELVIPASVTYIGENAFYGCTGLMEVNCLSPVDAVDITYERSAFGCCSSVVKVKLPQGLTTYDRLFWYGDKVTSLALPDTVTALGPLGENFRGMKTLRSVSLPGVTALESDEFCDCDSLDTIDISSVKEIPGGALSGAGKNLKELYLSKSLVSFGDSSITTYPAFIYYPGSLQDWGKITFGDSVLDGIEKSGTTVVCDYKASSEPLAITSQPKNVAAFTGLPSPATSFEVEVPQGATVSYFWYDQNGACVSVTDDASFSVTLASAGTFVYRCVAKAIAPDGVVRIASSDEFTVTVRAADGLFEGAGTEEDPYLLKSTQDLANLSTLVNNGVSYEGVVFKMVKDIELPSGWIPLGATKDGSDDVKRGKNLNAFKGIFDGGGHTLIVPAGEKPLFKYVWNTTVKNMNIYGERIEGGGLVDAYTGVGLDGCAVDIDGVNLKSGSRTLKSGLVASAGGSGFAHASSGFVVAIRNCVVEDGVTVGYDGTQSQIGSIAGRVNGVIEGCSSSAMVKGVNYVGGMLGTRDNAMGQCVIENSSFHGAVESSGNCAGGIVGGGYDNSTAPNGARPTIEGCSVDGLVTGVCYVGGIFGGDLFVAQTWDNVVGSISDNVFSGKVSGSEYVGAVIGYLDSLNRYDSVSGNVFTYGCGADKGISFVKYIDTSCQNPVVPNGTVVFNTANGTAACPEVTGCAWKVNHNRADDPLGADADALCKMIVPGPEEIKLGDVNGNLRVNIVDAQIVYDMARGRYGDNYVDLPLSADWTHATLLWTADVNRDGVVDAADAFAIQHFAHCSSWN